MHTVCGTLGHCFIHDEDSILQIYFMWYSAKRHHTRAHVTSGTLVHCALSLATRRTQRAEQWVDFAGQWSCRLLLRLPAAVVPPLLPQNNLLTSPAFAPDSELVSATRISLMASSPSFIYFFPAIAWDPHQLPCLDYYVWLGTVSKT